MNVLSGLMKRIRGNLKMSYRYGIIKTNATTEKAGVFLVDQAQTQETKPIKKKTETETVGLIPIGQNGIIQNTNLKGESQWKTR